MEGKQSQFQAQVQGQTQHSKAKRNPKVQNEPRKAVEMPKMDNDENETQTPSQSIYCESNAELQKAEPDLKMNPDIKASTPEAVEIKTENLNENNDEDKKQEKPSTEQTPAVTSNGVKLKPSDAFNNERKVRGPDKEGSEFDEGYTVPKKRKAKRLVNKVKENYELVKIIAPIRRVPVLQQSFEHLKLHNRDPRNIRVDSTKSVWKPEKWAVGAGHGRAGPGYKQNASVTNPGLNSPKVDMGPKSMAAAPAVPKEKAFKRSTVFSVSNNGVPKVSYASMVKQNLYKLQNPTMPTESCSEPKLSPAVSSSSAIMGSPILTPDHHLTQVPAASENGSDKSTDADDSQALSLEVHLIKSPSSSTKSVTHKINLDCPDEEPSLFTCPSNMPDAPGSLMPTITSCQTNVQMLKKVFQNKWGLSFISEVNISPEISPEAVPDPEVIQPLQALEYPKPLSSQKTKASASVPELIFFPKNYDLRKCNKSQALGDTVKPDIPVIENEGLKPERDLRDDDLQQADHGSQEAVTLLPSNYEESAEPFPSDPLFESTSEGLEQETKSEPFDVRSAIEYHMKEMESVWAMGKEDPKSVIIYDECKDQ